MFQIKHVLIVVGIIVILYFIYKYNKKSSKHIEQLDNVTTSQSQQPIFGVYYTEWCHYSQDFLKQLSSGLSDAIQKTGVQVQLVDCDKDSATCSKYNVQGFPTLLLHTSNGTIHYDGQRDEQSIINFIKSNL